MAAKEKNPSKVLEFLKASGKWTLELATKIGIPIAVAVIEEATGIKTPK